MSILKINLMQNCWVEYEIRIEEEVRGDGAKRNVKRRYTI